MKSNRSSIVVLTIVLLIWISLSSCEDESQGQSTTQNTETESKPNTYSDINKEVKDSLDRYSTKIEEACKKAEDSSAEVAKMGTTVNQLQDNELWLWISVGIGIIGLIIGAVCLKLFFDLQSRANRQRSDIQKLQRERPINLTTPNAVPKSTVPSDYEFLKRRVSNLETQIKQIKSFVPESQELKGTQVFPQIRDFPSPKNGYFGNPIQAPDPYFKKILVSRDSEARFSVEICGDKASFRPFESSSYLGTYISHDAMRSAIDFVGDCPPNNNPSSMRVITPGEAEQRDNRWFIIKKAQVKLSR